MGCKESPWIASVFLSLVVGLKLNESMTWAVSVDENAPKDFKYVHLWVSLDGETHVKDCKMHNFTLAPYSLVPQYLKGDFQGSPLRIVFSQLPLGFIQGPHNAPEPQFVITLRGNWYVNASDGSLTVFQPGDVFFQDDVISSPARKIPKHSSGLSGNIPCQQLMVQINRTAEVDKPCPF